MLYFLRGCSSPSDDAEAGDDDHRVAVAGDGDDRTGAGAAVIQRDEETDGMVVIVTAAVMRRTGCSAADGADVRIHQ